MSDKIYIFACDDECARQVYQDNQPSAFAGGFVVVKHADDLAGEVLEEIEIARCYHRWTARVETAFNHLAWCAWQLDPVEERYGSQVG